MHDPDDLTRASDDELRDLVGENLAPADAAPGLWEALTQPPLAGRVRNLLIEMQRRVDDSLRKRQGERDAHRSRFRTDRSAADERDYANWRARAIKFKLLVQDRLRETRAGAAQHNLNQTDLVRWHRQAVRTLVLAIERHRRALDDVDPEPEDQELWKVLDEVTVPFGPHQHPVSVRQLADAHWYRDSE